MRKGFSIKSASGSTRSVGLWHDLGVKPTFGRQLDQVARQIRCSSHATGNPFISAGSVIASGCRPSMIASTISGASRVIPIERHRRLLC
jgi:hypothetical protein